MKGSLFEHGVGHNVAIHALPAARSFAFLVSVFLAHTTSSFWQSSSNLMGGVCLSLGSEGDFNL